MAWGKSDYMYTYCQISEGGKNGNDPKFPRGKYWLMPVFPPGEKLAWGKNDYITPVDRFTNGLYRT